MPCLGVPLERYPEPRRALVVDVVEAEVQLLKHAVALQRREVERKVGEEGGGEGAKEGCTGQATIKKSARHAVWRRGRGGASACMLALWARVAPRVKALPE